MSESLDPAGGGLGDSTGLSLTSRGLFAPAEADDLHPRTRIRRFVVEVLRQAAGAASGQVHSNRAVSLKAAALPAIVVYTRDERVAESRQKAPRILVRTLELVVEIYAQQGVTTDELLSAFAKRVEWLVHQDESQGGVADSTELRATEMQIAAEGDRLMGCCRLIFDVTYERATEEDVLPSLAGIDIRWDIAVPDDQIDARDTIDFPEE